jgi:hypothetical protein
VDEDVCGTIIRGYKPIAFLTIKPFNGTFGHSKNLTAFIKIEAFLKAPIMMFKYSLIIYFSKNEWYLGLVSVKKQRNTSRTEN